MIKKEWLDDYKLKAESILELDVDVIRKNLAKIILTLIEEINSKQQLSDCAHCFWFCENDAKDGGDCNNMDTPLIILGHPESKDNFCCNKFKEIE